MFVQCVHVGKETAGRKIVVQRGACGEGREHIRTTFRGLPQLRALLETSDFY